MRTVFDHIPKTAGTSVIAAMEQATGTSGRLPEASYPHHVALSLAKERRFLTAHLWFYNGEPLAGGWFYASLLRDPVDRFLSQYYYHRGLADQVARGMVKDPAVHAAVRLELGDFVNEPGELRRSFANVQARHFADRMCDAEGLNDSDLLDAAIAGASAYGLIGVFSRLQEFVDAYCDTIGVRRRRLSVLNVTPNRRRAGSLPPELIERLKACNAADYGLYAWAEQHFAARRPSRLFGLLKRLLPERAAAATADEAADFGTKAIEILSVSCIAADGGGVPQAGAEMQVRIACRSAVEEADLTVGLALRDSSEATVFGVNSRQAGTPVAVGISPAFTIVIALRAPARAGTYRLTLALHKGETHLEGCYHWLDRAAQFEVAGAAPSEDGAPNQAVFSLLSD